MTDDELTEIEKRANVATAGLIAALRDARAALAETRYAALMAAGVRGGPNAWRWEQDPTGTTLDDEAAWARLLGEMRPRQDRAIRNLLDALAHAFECVGTEAERPKGGMSVSFHGDFASAVRLPSVVGEMRSWAKRSRDVLRGDERAVATWSGVGACAPEEPAAGAVSGDDAARAAVRDREAELDAAEKALPKQFRCEPALLAYEGIPRLVADWQKRGEELDAAREQNAELRRQLANQQRNNHQRNVDLDALHYVWCDGGCQTGVHRFDGKGPSALTAEVVAAAVRNTRRLVHYAKNVGVAVPEGTANEPSSDSVVSPRAEERALHCPVCKLPGLPPDAREWPSHEPIWTEGRRYLCSGCGTWLVVQLDGNRAYLAEDGK